MVCVPCFIIPVLLFVWHRFIQPIVLRYWNPWAVKDKDGNVIKSEAAFPFQCAGGQCPFPVGNKKQGAVKNGDAETISNETRATEDDEASATIKSYAEKKID